MSLRPHLIRPDGHGTVSNYVYGCRCPDCRQASTDYARERAARARAGTNPRHEVADYSHEVLIDAPGPWVADAACAGEAVDVWFPVARHVGRGGIEADAEYQRQVATAKAVCRSCPVLAECATYIAAHPQPGIWAGLTEHERRQRRTA